MNGRGDRIIGQTPSCEVNNPVIGVACSGGWSSGQVASTVVLVACGGNSIREVFEIMRVLRQ